MSNDDITKRSLLQATYTPIKTKAGLSDKGGRGIEKCAFISQLNPTVEELEELKEKYLENEARNRGALELIDILLRIISMTEEESESYCARLMAEAEGENLVQVARDLLNMRQKILEQILDSYEDFLAEISGRRSQSVQNMSANEVLSWAIANNFKKDLANMIIKLARSSNINLNRVNFEQLLNMIIRKTNQLRKSLTGFQENMKVLPVGYLHLEKLSFTPADIENGELVYSVPLSPGEEVNITHREWANTTEEYEKIVTDYLEKFSEEGVTEKSELAESVSTQNQHSSAFNTGVTASGGYGGVNITTSFGLNASESESNSREMSRNHSSELTHKASSRSKKEHKMSFKVSSAAETEDVTIRKIKNPFLDRAARVDYYQFMRKWQVELYRYGIRLTWDITIPEPGSGILSKIIEINNIREELGTSFDEVFNLKPSEINRDELPEIVSKWGVPVQDSPDDEETDVFVLDEVPTPSNKKYIKEFIIPDNYTATDEAYFHCGYNYVGEPSTTVSWGIHVQDISNFPYESLHANGKDWTPFSLPGSKYNKWKDRTGKLAIHVNHWKIKFWFMSIRIKCKLLDSAREAWKQRVWETIRNGFQAQFYERRQMLKDRLAQLEQELGDDTLTLRKREREEVMKGVLRWMDIQGFTFYPPDIPEDLETTEEEGVIFPGIYSEETGLVVGGFDPLEPMHPLTSHGEKIKFLHHAIEWENMLYFLYPYFWSHATNWQDKKYLDHPDPLHRAFLKAGSARVVLTIRPGFEDAFMAFINTGEMDQLPPTPFLEIGQEFKNYANTNYPGIPPANPVENYRPLLYPLQRQAWEDMQKIMSLLELYYNANNNTYPTTAQRLDALNDYTGGDIPEVPTKDPWGNDYVYTCPGVHGEYDLVSYGRDGNPGGEGEDADITNYAEASLIGRWFEYTPTSALDIKFEPKPITEEIQDTQETRSIPTLLWVVLGIVSVASIIAVVLAILGVFT